MDAIIVLDFGSQYTHLIANRIRRLNVFSEIKAPDSSLAELRDAKGIILSGGPSSVYDRKKPGFNKDIFKLGIPVLGLCYGHQLMAHELGGKVKPGKVREFGIARLKIKNKKNIFKGLKSQETVWMSHGDSVVELPPDFEILASTEDCRIAAMGNTNKNFYGFQFHPEVTHTPNGMKILSNFAFNICKCRKEWTMASFIDKKIKEIQEFVKEKNVFLLVSGGVDSTVCFALLNKALGPERVYGLHIDNGLVRKNESDKVKIALEAHGFRNFHVVDASKEFLNALKNVYDPEKKRNIIGDKFIEIQQKEVEKLKLNPHDWLLGQGTIYPDTIETAGTKEAALIKTHHNRVKAIQELIEKGRLIEPIKELYKDEVRELGLKLGLPKNLVYRHPFPGPGLGVRILCIVKEFTPKNIKEIKAKADKIAEKYRLKAQILPVRSVGVQGDFRTYKNPIVLTGKAGWNKLEKASTEITNKIRDINRVVYLIKPENIRGIKIKKASITKERADLAREADDIVAEALIKNKLYNKIWQMPVVLLPLGINNESIVLRPVYSREAMTAKFAEMPFKILNRISEKILKLKIDFVFYDITNKPPATIEWE